MSNVKNIIHHIAEDDLSGALDTFKSVMASKLMEGIEARKIQIHQELAESNPDLFVSPVDQAAVEDPEENLEEPVENVAPDAAVSPEQGHRGADYDGDEDKEVNEETEKEDDDVSEETDDELEEEEKPDFLDLDKDGDKEEPMTQAAKDAE